MLPVQRAVKDGIICHFSFSSLCLFGSFFQRPGRPGSPSPVPMLLGCPLNSQPPRILHRPSNPGCPAPSGRGGSGRTPKSEWLFQDSVAVETGCTGLGGPLHHPPATQPMASELHPGLRAPSSIPGSKLHPGHPRPTAAGSPPMGMSLS